MEASWTEVRLSSICEAIDYGYTASADTAITSPKFLRITDIVRTPFLWRDVPGVEITAAQFEKYRLHDGDIVIARTGATTGESMWITNPPEAIFASYLIRLRIKPEFSAEFVAHWLKSRTYKSFIAAVLGDKSAQPNASAKTLTRAMIRLPSLVKQQRIAEILTAFDKKLALNDEQGAALQNLARTLFQSWFVDFDPVLRAVAGNDTGVPPHRGSVCKSDMTNDALPDGWSALRADSLARLVRESVDPGSIDPLTAYVALEHLDRNNLGLRRWDTAASAQSLKLRFNEGDLLFGKLRPYFHKVCIAPFSGICSSDIFVFRCDESRYREFMYMAFSTESFIAASSNSSTGTRMPRADWQHMGAKLFNVGPPNVMQQFSNAVSPLISRLQLLVQQSLTLVALRDALLPRLISGELRIRDAEKLL